MITFKIGQRVKCDSGGFGRPEYGAVASIRRHYVFVDFGYAGGPRPVLREYLFPVRPRGNSGVHKSIMPAMSDDALLAALTE